MTADAIRCVTVDEVVDAVTEHARRQAPLRVVGRGRWLDAGRAVRADATPLDVSALGGVIQYTPGDLTCTVGAGMTLAELDALTAPHGQWCPLLPWGGDDGTVGATLATATTGPCADALGLPRDLALGLELVDGRGSRLRAGGSVVKNVAGFDLVRLNVGAWGSLGVITQASLRLRARPATDVTFALPFDQMNDVGRLELLRTGPLTLIAIELVNRAAARALDLGDTGVVLLRAAGNAAFVRALEAALRAGGAVTEVSGDVWTRLRTIEPARAVTWRQSMLPASWHQLAPAMLASNEEAGRDVFAHLSVARGVMRVMAAVRDDESDGTLAARATATLRLSMHHVPERGVPDAAGIGEMTGAFRLATTDALAQRVRSAFDPAGVLNPGVLG